MEKKYIIGGLAIVGAIALFAYLKPKPRRNSEGFFGANGRLSSPLEQKEIIPSFFVRKGGFPSGCARYEKFLTPTGNGYIKRKFIKSNVVGMPDQVSIELFPITKEEFLNAFKSNAFC